MNREAYMAEAVAEAHKCLETDDVPVGCVIVQDGRIIARGRNRREGLLDATAHAEIEALRAASQALGRWHLPDCTMYVTLEPCPMCAGAILNAHVGTVVFGARDERSGACGGLFDLFAERVLHHPRVYPGVLAKPCTELLQDFFREKRISQ